MNPDRLADSPNSKGYPVLSGDVTNRLRNVISSLPIIKIRCLARYPQLRVRDYVFLASETQKLDLGYLKRPGISLLITSGEHELNLYINARHCVFKSGRIYLFALPAGCSLSARVQEGHEYRFLDIHLGRAYFDSWQYLQPDLKILANPVYADSTECFAQSGQPLDPASLLALHELRSCKLKKLSRALFFQSRILAILSTLFNNFDQNTARTDNVPRIKKKDLDSLQKAKDLIDRSPEKFYSIAQLAVQTGINSSKLKRGFMNLYGYGIFEYSNKVRMAQAMELVTTSDRSMKEIAFDLGYSSAPAFSAAFRKYFGKAPAFFRK